MKHDGNADRKENVMESGKRASTTMGLAALSVLAGATLVAHAADMTYKAELSPVNVKTTGPRPAEKRRS